MFDMWKSSHGTPPPTKPPHALPAPKKAEPPKTGNPFAIWKPAAPAATPPPPAARLEPDPFAPFAKDAPKPRSFQEALVPEGEQGSQYRTEKEAFDVWKEEPSPPPQPPRRPEPSQEAPHRGPRPDPWLDRLFNFNTFWDHIREHREDPRFQEDLDRAKNRHLMDLPSFLAHEFADAGDDQDLQIAWTLGITFTKIEDAYVEGGEQRVWEEVLGPELARVQDAVNELMPRDLTGALQFGETQDGRFGLLYIEDPLRRLR